MTARVSSPVFIGRAAELDALERAMQRAESGAPSIVLVGGEAGIGKSRLVAEAAAHAAAGGAIVLRGACVDLGGDDGLPFAPIAEVLRELVRRLDAASLASLMDPATLDLARLLPALGNAAASSDLRLAPPGELAQTRLLEAFLTLLGRVGSMAPVIIVLEDLHWADAATRDLVAFLARNARDERLCVIGTYRTDELHRRHPLQAWLAELHRVASVDLVRLRSFDPTESAAQIEAILGNEVQPEVISAIHERTEGNPFFAEELLAAGATRPDDQLPANLRDVLLVRVSALSEPARRLLGVAAVGGQTTNEDLLARVAGLPLADVAASLEEAASHGLVVPDASLPAYAFRHALLREAVYDDLLPGPRRRLHAAFAAALAEAPRLDGAAGAAQLAEIAGHASAAHDLPMALRHWLEAARASMRAFAIAGSAASYERALELWDVVPPGERPEGIEYVDLLEEAAWAMLRARLLNRSSELTRLAMEALDADADPARRVRVLEVRARSSFMLNDMAGAIVLLEEAAELVADGADRADAARILSVLSWTVWAYGNYRRATEIAERAVAIAGEAGELGPELMAMRSQGAAYVVTGDADRGLPLLREALAKAKSWNNYEALLWGYEMLATGLGDSDELDEAVEVEIEALAWARSFGSLRASGGFLAVDAARTWVRLGEWGQAQAMCDEFGRTGPQGLGELQLGAMSSLLAVRKGELEAARPLHGLIAAWSTVKWDAAMVGHVYEAQLELALAEHRYQDGRSDAERAIDLLEGTDDVRFRSRLIELAIRVESELAAIARARRDGPGERAAIERGTSYLDLLRSLMAAHADPASPVFAHARRNAVLAEAEATRLIGASDPARWSAAADVFRARGFPYELAWCRYRQAEAQLAAGESRAAAAVALSEAASICRRLGARPLHDEVTRLAAVARLELTTDSASPAEPAPQEASTDGALPADPYGLTAREQEVLGLLASGMSNRGIADALFISESTVRVHVSNILGKLGVANRVEAATIAVRLSAAPVSST
jgi:DNA-binding CsgD family transcriptional regulator